MTDHHALTTPRKRLLRNHDTLVQWIQHALNIAVISIVLPLLTYLEEGKVSMEHRVIIILAVLLMTIVYHLMGVFRRFRDLFSGIQHLARAWGVVIILLSWITYVTGISDGYSRNIVVTWVFASFLAQAVILTLTFKWFEHYRRKYNHRKPAIIVGTGPIAKHLASSITNNIWFNYDVIGAIRHEEEQTTWDHSKIPLLGEVGQLLTIIKERDVGRVYLALPLHLSQAVKDIQDRLADMNLDIVWAPDIFEFQLVNHSVREVAGIPLLNINETPLMAGGPAFVKTVMDRAFSAALIVLLSPVLLACALAVRFTSDGPVIFKQQRDGWDGRKFAVYKFRSMYVHEAKEVVEQAKKNDSRITPVGRFLRKTSLDELPQLFNVLEGTMSLVGPRPHAVSHNVYYSTKVKTYLARHRLKPGITGLAQVKGYRGETTNIEDMVTRVRYDLEYIRNWTPWLDIKILFATPASLLRKSENAY